MPVPSEPRLGLLKHRCPYCRTAEADFIEEDVYERTSSGPQGSDRYVSLKHNELGTTEIGFARQRCAVCTGVIFFVGDRMVYPHPDPKGDRYDTWPPTLCQHMQHALRTYLDDPAATATKLRGVLEELCALKGMDPTEPYVKHVKGCLPEKYVSQLQQTCYFQDGAFIPTDYYRKDDDLACAGQLIHLVHVTAWEFFGLLAD